MDKLKIMFAISEVDGFVKTGGLADIGYSLPVALKAMGHDVRLVLPHYKTLQKKPEQYNVVTELGVPMGGREYWCSIHEGSIEDVPVYFVEFNQFFYRDGLYDDGHWPYPDNAERFGFFSRAVIQVCQALHFSPDIIHCNDWHTSLTPYYLHHLRFGHPILQKTTSVLSIHNAAFHGNFHPDYLNFLGIPRQHFHMHGFEDYGRINLLKGGIAWADKINTVSPGYAEELLTYLGGHGLQVALYRRRRDFCGILNGCDYQVWNPEFDDALPARYSSNHLEGKRVCKAELQRFMHLPEQKHVPVLGIISRLTRQKGFDYLLPAMYQILEQDAHVQFVILGTGESWIEQAFNELAYRFPHKVGWKNYYDWKLSHWIEAGSDFFLMPSLYEPCGLNQMYSLKYGTIPIVRHVGGLKDTVRDQSKPNGNGFTFLTPDYRALVDCIYRAVHFYYNHPNKMTAMVKNAMSENFNWDKSAKEYVKMYHEALEKVR